MEKGTSTLSHRLLDRIHSAKTLKLVINTLEELTQNHAFKQHSTSIVTDPNLTDNQKRTQLLYLIKSIEIPELYDFFSDELGQDQYWIFNAGKVDYLDKFVQEFQRVAESAEIVDIATAVPLTAQDITDIGTDMTSTFGTKVIVNHTLNHALVGGMMIKIKNLIFDYSLRAKFRTFQKQWLQSLEKTETQIGRHEIL